MHLHIVQIGTERVGRPTAYTIMCSKLTDKLTVCDVKPALAATFAEELKHVTASIGLDVELDSCSKNEDIVRADIINLSMRAEDTRRKMTPRDLAVQNAKIIKQVSEATISKNRGAKYIVITNPVDAMTIVCKKYTRADCYQHRNNLESLRFR